MQFDRETRRRSISSFTRVKTREKNGFFFLVVMFFPPWPFFFFFFFFFVFVLFWENVQVQHENDFFLQQRSRSTPFSRFPSASKGRDSILLKLMASAAIAGGSFLYYVLHEMHAESVGERAPIIEHAR